MLNIQQDGRVYRLWYRTVPEETQHIQQCARVCVFLFNTPLDHTLFLVSIGQSVLEHTKLVIALRVKVYSHVTLPMESSNGEMCST